MNQPVEPESENPLTWFLVRAGDGLDHLIVRFDHGFMDVRALGPLLGEVDRLSADDADLNPRNGDPRHDLFEGKGLLRLAVSTIYKGLRDERKPKVGPSIALVDRQHVASGSDQKLLFHQLDERETESVRNRISQIPGRPPISLAALASLVSTVARQSRDTKQANSVVTCPIAVPLRTSRDQGVVLCNLTSLVPLEIPIAAAESGEGVIASLTKQLRAGIKNGSDRRNLAAVRYLPTGWIFRKMVQWGYRHQASIRYGHVGDLLGRETICGARVRSTRSFIEALSPQGFSLTATENHSRLGFSVAYIPRLLPDTNAQELMDGLIEDLLA